MDVGCTNERAIELVYKSMKETELGGGWATCNPMQKAGVYNLRGWNKVVD